MDFKINSFNLLAIFVWKLLVTKVKPSYAHFNWKQNSLQ